MVRRQCDESPTAASEEWITSDHERIDPAFDKASEGRIDLAFSTGGSNMDLLVECAPGRWLRGFGWKVTAR